MLLEEIAKPHPEFLTQEIQILFSFLWLIISTRGSDVRLGLICISLSTIFTSLFFCLLLVVWRNMCCLTTGSRGSGVSPGWSSHTRGDRHQTLTWGSQCRGTEAPPVCCIMRLWSVSFGYLTSTTQAAKVLPSSWFLGKQRCWYSGVELS